MNRKRLRQILIGLLSTIVVIALILGGYLFWRDHRPQPPSVRETLFNGITYIRDVRQQPRPLIIHVVQIDLTTPGLGFLVTPGDPVDGHEVRAQTVSEFLSKYNLQLAINGDFFWPWWYHTILDYYPHDHDPTDVNGFAASRGAIYSEEQPDDPRPTLYLSLDNRAGIDQPIGAVYNAISGLPLIVEDGHISTQIKPDEYYAGVHPRSAVGLDRERKTLLLFVVDGRQPNYSEGVTLPELAQIAIEYGADSAINLDGGGSSTLVVEDQAGKPRVLNSPIHANVPGMERPVGNQLGVWVTDDR
ncbi:MAG TPA: phosphodiester glycosidase family protein [Anaerolineae bacterium]|nr:phosphodiester glycosidase family protein [Anaerolineae bacterium]